MHFPDPVVSPPDGLDPEQEALLADAVGLALLVGLDTLPPDERLAFVLHDTFGVPYEEIGRLVGRSPNAAAQLASQAPSGRAVAVIALTVRGGRVTAIDILADPTRLSHLPLPTLAR